MGDDESNHNWYLHFLLTQPVDDDDCDDAVNECVDSMELQMLGIRS